ncbi:MAG TPA: HAD family hydrolase [Mobilitalea sp.]|nr:HAD family hydrolase [Mobilitalea sp.]
MIEKKLIIFIDSGDTIIDEGTEIRDENGIVFHAETIEGAAQALQYLHEAGYTIALVADGEEQSFTNMYQENQLGYCFTSRTISEIVGQQKPSQSMFEDALQQNNLSPEDKKRIVMIGNNIKKDVVGANRFGITSILLDWSPRYPMTPQSKEETPDYIIHKPAELVPLIEKLDSEL